jgi:uncharacterized glyoxalase superfamily protein PhnB
MSSEPDLVRHDLKSNPRKSNNPVKTMSTPAKSNVKPIPDGMHSITPHLICAGASDAIEFYKKAFGAKEGGRLEGPNGKIMHASVMIGDSHVFLFDEMPEFGAFGPKALKGSSVTIHLYTEDVDALWAQAVKAGAKVIMPLDNAFWGDRYGKLEDPFGHHWSLASHVVDLTPDEIKKGMANACCGENKK